MNIPQRTCLIRLYNNGDSKTGAAKFFLSTRMANALAIRVGDAFELRRRSDGSLDLVPQRVVVDVANGQAIPADGLTIRSLHREVPA